MAKRILSVGQCGADHAGISEVLKRHFDVAVETADSVIQALSTANDGFALVLVNRILDRTGEEGLELIGKMQAEKRLKDIPVMLVSNYDDAQQAARAAGARPGFGKSTMGDAESIELLRPLLGEAE